MTDNAKVFKLVVQGDTADVEKQLKTLKDTAASIGLEITKTFSTSNTALGSTATTVQLVSKNFRDMQQVAKEFNTAFDKAGLNKYFTDTKTGAVEVERVLKKISAAIDTSVKSPADAIAKRLAAFRQATDQAMKLFEQKVGLLDTPARVKKSTRTQEYELQKKLLTQIAELERQIASGSSKNPGVSAAKAAKEINSTLEAIKNVRAKVQAEIDGEKAKQLAARETVAAEKQAQKEIADVVKRRLQQEKADFEFLLAEFNRMRKAEIAAEKEKQAELLAIQKAADAERQRHLNSALVRGMSGAASFNTIMSDAYKAKIAAGMSASGQLAGGLLSQSAAQSSSQLSVNSSRLRENKRAAEETSISHKNLALRILEIIGIYRAYNLILNTTSSALKAIPKIGIELESTKASLTATTGSSAGMVGVLEALTKEADRTGITLSALRENFRTFQASTSLAGESLETSWKIFQNINTVITSLHLPAEKAVGIFNALAQIFNKSKVQSEELVKQLGNLIPGAFAAFAAANASQFKNAADLIEQMKKGTVFAHKTVENFAEFLANRFAASFEIASRGLNANIGRMQNSFTLLGEAIYRLSSAGINSVVLGLTNMAKAMTSAVNGVDKLSTAFTLLKDIGVTLVAALGLSALDKWVTAAGVAAQKTHAFSRALGIGITESTRMAGAAAIATAAVGKLKSALMFFANPVVVLAGLTEIILKFKNMQAEANEAAGDAISQAETLIKASKQQTTDKTKLAFGIDFDPNKDEAVVAVRESIKNIRESIEDLSSRKLTQGFSTREAVRQEEERIKKLEAAKAKLAELLEVEKQELQTAKTRLELQQAMGLGMINQAGESIQQIKKKADLEKLQFTDPAQYAKEHYLKVNEAKLKHLREVVKDNPKLIQELEDSIVKLENGVKKLQGAAAEELTVKIASQKEILAQLKQDSIDAADAIKQFEANAELAKNNAGAKVNSKRLASDLREIQIETKTSVEKTRGSLLELEAAYNRGTVSIKQYYAKQKEVLEQVAEEELLAIQSAKERAEKVGRFDKAAEFDAKFWQRQAQFQNDQTALFIKENQDAEAFKDTLTQVRIEYLKLKGDLQGAAGLEFDLQNKIQSRRIQSEGATEAQAQMKVLREHALVISDLQKANEKQKIFSDQLANKELQIQTAKNIGAAGELSTLLKLQEARQEYIRQVEEQIQLQEKLLVDKNVTEEEAQAIKNARAQLEAFKEESKLVSNFFQTTVTKSFADSFSSFVTGAQTAGEAFRGFAQNVIKSLADIAAQEMASQVFSLVKSAFSSFSGASGGMSFLGGSLPSDKGNVFAGGNVVPFARGGIPDIGSKMQYFPMANGGVGSLREKGPEAILPLKRDAYGNLGVKALPAEGSNKSSGGNVYHINISVPRNKDESAESFGTKAAEAMMKAIAKKEIEQAARPGNILNRTTKVG